MKMKGLRLRLKEPYLRSGGQAGFSLIELLISLAVLSVFMTAIYAILIGQTRSYTTQEVAAGVQQTVRVGVEIMLQDLRLAGLDPEKTGYFGFETAETTSFRITSDRPYSEPDTGFESNGNIDNDNFERVTYYYDATKRALEQRLYEGTDEQDTQTLIENVTGVAFAYFNEDGDRFTLPIEDTEMRGIRSVEVTLTVTEPAGRDGMLSRTYSSRVRCRNMGL